MDESLSIIIGLMLGLGIGFALAYFIYNNQKAKKLIVLRNKDGLIDGITEM